MFLDLTMQVSCEMLHLHSAWNPRPDPSGLLLMQRTQNLPYVFFNPNYLPGPGPGPFFGCSTVKLTHPDYLCELNFIFYYLKKICNECVLIECSQTQGHALSTLVVVRGKPFVFSTFVNSLPWL